jgi:hypothetical protein
LLGYAIQKGNYKMGKLSKAKKLTETEKFCIEGMLSNGMEIDAVAKALDRPVSLIQKLIDDYNDEPGPMMINETASGNKGVTVMTEVASYNVDEAKKRFNKTAPKQKPQVIHKINE